MYKVFVESREFTQWVSEYLDDEVYADLQQRLVENPDLGSVMPGCGGLRKVRVADPRRRKGKRGGARIIYLHVPEGAIVLLLDIYGKDEKDDLTAAERKQLRRLAEQFKSDAIRATQRGRRGAQ